MYVIVSVNGGQGFLPDEVKGDVVLQQLFAQDIVDRYCGIEYFDRDIMEYKLSLWYRIKVWLRACPLIT